MPAKNNKRQRHKGHKIKMSCELSDFGVPLFRVKNKNLNEAMQEIYNYLDNKFGVK